MPISETYLRTTVELLSNVRPVTAKKMFGGAGLYCEEVFFAVIDDDRLYLKVDQVNLPDFEAFDAEPWIMDLRNPKPAPYRELPAEILHDPQQLGAWIDAAVAVARRKAKSKR
ncbi:MAG: TfoX/Sxy family protein [Fimbriimonadaceae bacterium]